METNITKGDWSVNSIDLADYKSLAVISEKAQKVICHCHLSDMKMSKENMENAQLISAAPDLLSALKNLMEGVESLPPSTSIVCVLDKQYKDAENAIKKAYGHHF
jgi:hypothetical protein